MFLALWLPATQHCGLEAAGLISGEAQHAAPAQCCNTSDRCSHDGCNVVESGVIKPVSEASKVLAPDLSLCLCYVCLQLVRSDLLDDSALLVSEPARPLDWVSTWQFVRRAAPLARAPSLVG